MTTEGRFVLTPYDRTRDRIRDTETKDCDYLTSMADACDRLNELAAELARVTAERDRLIEAWPEYNGTAIPSGLVRTQHDKEMRHDWASDGGTVWLWRHDTKEQAVRAAAGLDAREGE